MVVSFWVAVRSPDRPDDIFPDDKFSIGLVIANLSFYIFLVPQRGIEPLKLVSKTNGLSVSLLGRVFSNRCILPDLS